VSVRRLFIFLEASIYEGTQWVVFEPNNENLWARVNDTIRLFLRGQWRLGGRPQGDRGAPRPRGQHVRDDRAAQRRDNDGLYRARGLVMGRRPVHRRQLIEGGHDL
jgi:hypothetical protein